MLAQLKANESLTVVMSGAANTTNPTYAAQWREGSSLNNPVGSLSGATAVDTTGALTIAVAIDRQGTATDSDSARLDILTVDVIG